MRPYTPEADLRSGFREPIATARWGPTFWDTLHYVSLGYPEANPSEAVRDATFAFFSALPFVLPCALCREHLAEAYLTDMPLTRNVFDSRQTLGTFVVQLRDLVKKKHACPGCPGLREHAFPDDVAPRLLGGNVGLQNKRPQLAWLALLLFLIPIPLFMLLRRRYTRKYG